DGSDDGRLGGADQITDDRLPVGDAVEVKVLARRQPSRHLGKLGRFANGGDQSHAVLDTSRGAVAESLGRRDVVLGQGWQAKMTCDGTEVDKNSGAGSDAPAPPAKTVPDRKLLLGRRLFPRCIPSHSALSFQLTPLLHLYRARNLFR